MTCLNGLRAVILFAAFGAVAGVTAAAERLTESEFRALHAELQQQDAPWRSVPWNISLLDAQNQAAESGKPLFIWAMDGHPLGCT